MEIRVLRYFLEVAREGSITHAAQRLHISQPTLSKQLKDLEGELGKKLFTRSSFSVRLTEEGMLLRKRAEDILDMVDKTEEEFKALGAITGGDIHIGCAESEGIKHLAKCMKDLKEQHPGIRVHLYSGDTNDLAGRLEQGLLDYAVTAQAVDLSKHNYLELPWADIWGVVLRRDDPLSAKASLGVEDLLDKPLIVSRQGLREDLPRLFGEKVDQLNVTATINLAYNGSILVREGIGYLLSFDKLANTGLENNLCFRPLSPRLETKLYVIWKKYQVFSPAAELLLQEMKGRYGFSHEE
ncbi:LysR family transcriptional regulator [Acutalibacter caecimuris]|uniref:LysR family transcriptional regulator n=1 Tax=Acutalibacter caecimuris TaxID=3093657 RepID=UPI002AC9C949|nr:LysR family transcriptional regulator [Acutalibacter sp. M00118]